MKRMVFFIYGVAGHLLLAAGMTAYMLLAVVFEERDLIAYFGSQYAE
jgi:protein-S-isoprenylcysteine O-methyltransferase Ste14